MQSVRSNQLPLAERDPQPTPQAMKKKKKKKKKKPKKGRQTKAVGAGLEGFVDWMDPTTSEMANEGEDDMSNLAAGFTVRM